MPPVLAPRTLLRATATEWMPASKPPILAPWLHDTPWLHDESFHYYDETPYTTDKDTITSDGDGCGDGKDSSVGGCDVNRSAMGADVRGNMGNGCGGEIAGGGKGYITSGCEKQGGGQGSGSKGGGSKDGGSKDGGKGEDKIGGGDWALGDVMGTAKW